MKKQPSISVVVTCYNSSATILQCLKGLEKQTLSRDQYEILVVDSSTDNTSLLIQDNYPKVRLIQSKTRLYYGMARNTGVKCASGKLILFIDSDCIAGENCVEQHLNYHEIHSEAIAIMGRITNGNPEVFWGWVIFLIEFALYTSSNKEFVLKNIITANTSFKARAFLKYGFFHTSKFGSEDKQFSELLQKNKEIFYFNPNATIAHINRIELKAIMKHLNFLGQSIAHVRLDSRIVALWKTYIYLFAPLLAPVRLVRCLFRSAKNIPMIIWRLSILWPFIFVGFISQGLGEFHYVWNFLRKRKIEG